MEVREMIELMKAVSGNGLTCFELEQGDLRLKMKCEKGALQTAGPAAAASGGFGREFGAAPGDGTDEGTGSGKTVGSPLVGTFYSSPSPDSEDFVRIGDTVKKGQVIGIVEAMKLMNEIECEYDGVVDEIFVKNGDIVEYGQPLMRIR